jgi:hypothetical protein
MTRGVAQDDKGGGSGLKGALVLWNEVQGSFTRARCIVPLHTSKPLSY